MQMPALALAAVAGRRAKTLELAQEIERRGFQGIYCASYGDAMGLCLSLAHSTRTIKFGTAVANIYQRHPIDMAQQAAYIHEIAEGRFSLGIGVSHAPQNSRLGVDTGKPLRDMRAYVARMREEATKRVGPLPPIVLATLRKKMVDLSVEVAEGAVWANAIKSHMAFSLSRVPQTRLDGGFFIGDMLNACIDENVDAAREVIQRELTGYCNLPNYRNYWKEAGYIEEMEAMERALEAGERERIPGLMSDRWLADVALFGTPAQVRDGLEAWFAAGMRTPVLVPHSANGGQFIAFQEMFDTFK